MAAGTGAEILEAARRRLLADGFAALSTRKVADEAGVPLSQIHYHFGSKDELILSLLRVENERLLERQSQMFDLEVPLSERWEQACDYFDVDIESGYVRVMQELTAAGWSSESIAKEMQQIWGAWTDLLATVAREAQAAGLDLGPFSPEDIAAVVSALFVGAESLILLGMEDRTLPYRQALRKVGNVIRTAERQG